MLYRVNALHKQSGNNTSSIGYVCICPSKISSETIYQELVKAKFLSKATSPINTIEISADYSNGSQDRAYIVSQLSNSRRTYLLHLLPFVITKKSKPKPATFKVFIDTSSPSWTISSLSSTSAWVDNLTP